MLDRRFMVIWFDTEDLEKNICGFDKVDGLEPGDVVAWTDGEAKGTAVIVTITPNEDNKWEVWFKRLTGEQVKEVLYTNCGLSEGCS